MWLFFGTHTCSVYSVRLSILLVVIIISIVSFVPVFCAIVLYIHVNGSVSIPIIISLC